MRLSAEINSQVKESQIQPSVLILLGKLGMWLSITLAIFYCLFTNLAGQWSILLSNLLSSFNFRFLSWIVLVVCLAALWLARKSVWQAMLAGHEDGKTALYGLVQRFLGLDIILTALLVLLAYPLPPAPDFLIFRLLTAVLAGFVLVFGKKAALVPAVVIGAYGFSLLYVSGLSVWLA
jgi:hypothetical protein